MGAGILPIAKHNHNIYIMLGRERPVEGFEDSKKWSDFGGGALPNETDEECAAREGAEETMEMFGTKETLRKSIEECIFRIPTESYVSYVVEVDYDETLPKKYEKIFKCIKKNNSQLIKDNNGYFEKDKMGWYLLKKFKDGKKDKYLRPFFREIIKQLCTELCD